MKFFDTDVALRKINEEFSRSTKDGGLADFSNPSLNSNLNENNNFSHFSHFSHSEDIKNESVLGAETEDLDSQDGRTAKVAKVAKEVLSPAAQWLESELESHPKLLSDVIKKWVGDASLAHAESRIDELNAARKELAVEPFVGVGDRWWWRRKQDTETLARNQLNVAKVKAKVAATPSSLPQGWSCRYCNQPVTIDDVTRSYDGERIITLWHCDGCEMVGATPNDIKPQPTGWEISPTPKAPPRAPELVEDHPAARELTAACDACDALDAQEDVTIEQRQKAFDRVEAAFAAYRQAQVGMKMRASLMEIQSKRRALS